MRQNLLDGMLKTVVSLLEETDDEAEDGAGAEEEWLGKGVVQRRKAVVGMVTYQYPVQCPQQRSCPRQKPTKVCEMCECES